MTGPDSPPDIQHAQCGRCGYDRTQAYVASRSSGLGVMESCPSCGWMEGLVVTYRATPSLGTTVTYGAGVFLGKTSMLLDESKEEAAMDDHEERRYENHLPGHDKFWSVTGPYQDLSRGADSWVVECRWGRCGTAGQHGAWGHGTMHAARAFRDTKIAEKLGKGYSFVSATPKVEVAVEMPNYDESTDTYTKLSSMGGKLSAAMAALGKAGAQADDSLVKFIEWDSAPPKPKKQLPPQSEILLCRGCQWSRPSRQYREPPTVCPNCFGSLVKVWNEKGVARAQGVDASASHEPAPSKARRMITLGKKS